CTTLSWGVRGGGSFKLSDNSEEALDDRAAAGPGHPPETSEPALASLRQNMGSGCDRGIYLHDDVPADRARAEARGEDSYGAVDHAAADGVVERNGNGRRRRVGHRLDVEVAALRRKPRVGRDALDHRAIGLVRHRQVDRVHQAAASAVGMRERPEL